MLSDEEIANLLGDDALKYLKNKQKGGSSNQKGSEYENFFAVYQIALLAPGILEKDECININSQTKAFVDDLIIDFRDKSFIQHFQLKNKSTGVSWDDGKHPIADDFYMQFRINRDLLHKTSEIKLVVSSTQLYKDLFANIPEHIQQYSQVYLFRYQPSLNKVLGIEDAFRQSIEYLCAFDNPSADKIECVASVLLGSWMSIEKKDVPIIEILKKAQLSSPSFIRSFVEVSLDQDVEVILKGIQGFTYDISRGFFKWEFSSLQEGTLSYSCDNERFTAFQNNIKKTHPTTFDELEGLLI